MSWRNFKGFPSIQEVECDGSGLKADVKVMSLRLFRASDNFELASLNVFASNCLTYTQYSSCRVNSTDTHKSMVRVLVYDLEEGESRKYECTVGVIGARGEMDTVVWSTVVTRISKYRVENMRIVY
jgi:hypothetical protein